jgi:hypothetical protein
MLRYAVGAGALAARARVPERIADALGGDDARDEPDVEVAGAAAGA